MAKPTWADGKQKAEVPAKKKGKTNKTKKGIFTDPRGLVPTEHAPRVPVHVTVVLRVLSLTEAIEVRGGQAGGDLDEHVTEGEGGQLRVPAGGRGGGRKLSVHPQRILSSSRFLTPPNSQLLLFRTANLSSSKFSTSPPPNSEFLLLILSFSQI